MIECEIVFELLYSNFTFLCPCVCVCVCVCVCGKAKLLHRYMQSCKSLGEDRQASPHPTTSTNSCSQSPPTHTHTHSQHTETHRTHTLALSVMRHHTTHQYPGSEIEPSSHGEPGPPQSCKAGPANIEGKKN